MNPTQSTLKRLRELVEKISIECRDNGADCFRGAILSILDEEIKALETK